MAVVSEIKRENKKIKSAQLDRITDIGGKKFAEKVASTKVCKGGVNEPLASAVIYGNSKKLGRYQRDRYIMQKIPNSCINITVTTSATTSANTIGDYKCVLEPFVNHKVFARVVTSDKRVGVCWWKGYEGNYDTAYDFITGNVINGASSAPTSLEGIYTITQGMVWTDNHHQLYTYKYAGLPAGTYNITVQLFDLTAMYGEGKEPTSIDALKLEYPEVEQENEAGGKVIVAKLPLDYTEVEYLESTGTQWIKLPNSIGTNKTKYKVVASALPQNEASCVVGSCNSYYGNHITLYTVAGEVEVRYYGNTLNRYSIDVTNKLTIEMSNFKVSINGIIHQISQGTQFIPNDDTYLFARTYNPAGGRDQLAKIRLYNAIIEDTNYKFNLIPVIRNSDNKPGMFDLVSQTFFTNQGTGEFLTGANVSTIFNVDTLTKSGKNLWDEQWEVGSYSGSTGEKVTYTDRIRSKNKCRCLQNTTYFFKTNKNIIAGNAYFFDSNSKFISVVNNVGNSTFTSPLNAYYMTFAFGMAYGTTYNNDIAIFEYPYAPAIYEPHQTPQVIEGLDLASAGSARDAIYVNCKDNTIDVGKVWKKTVVNRTDYSVLTTPQYEDITSTELGQALLNLSTYKDKTTVLEVDNDGNIDFEYWKQIDVVPSAYTRVRAIKSDGNQKITVQGVDADSMQYNSLTTSTPTNVLFQGDKERVYTIDGLSYKYNQLIQNGNFENKGTWRYGSENHKTTFSVSNNEAIMEITNASDTQGSQAFQLYYSPSSSLAAPTYIKDHKYLFMADVFIHANQILQPRLRVYTLDVSKYGTTQQDVWQSLQLFFTSTQDGKFETNVQYFMTQPVNGDYMKVRKFMLLDLTDMFGAGNEPTTLEAFYNTPQGKLFQAGYVPYTKGAIHSVESVYTGETKVKDIILRSVDNIKDQWTTDGTKNVKVGYVDLSDYNWTPFQRDTSPFFYSFNFPYNYLNGTKKILGNRDEYISLTSANDTTRIICKDGSDLSAMGSPNGLFIYELATPTTEQVEPVQLGAGLTFNDGSNVLDSTMFYKSVTLWLAKYYKDGKATKNLIPVVRNSDLKAGLYDVLENEFLANEGTGDFTYECL